MTDISAIGGIIVLGGLALLWGLFGLGRILIDINENMEIIVNKLIEIAKQKEVRP
jgi:hypothetical protein